jgi:ornithine decarboxylase
VGKNTNISSIIENANYKPVFAFRPHALVRSADFFTQNLDAQLLYAVKTNPDDYILSALLDRGIKSYDVASLAEVAKIYNFFPEAKIYFMHPVKSRYAIRESYYKYNVRHFSLDSYDELRKIMEETDNAKDLSLHVRLSIPNTYAEISLSDKFGINLKDAPNLILETRKYSKRLGICFHCGSQTMHPNAYKNSIRIINRVIEKLGVEIDYFNVGGGFPSIYPGMVPPNLSEYFSVIHQEFKKIKNHKNIKLLAEPGRALVAESMSLIVRVELRRGNILYINDGTYGSLFDAGTPNFIFPTSLIRNNKKQSANLAPFSFYGPTCDSLDFMKGPFYLPDDICEGDYIEIGQMGAYAKTMATNFNGFESDQEVFHVDDEPLMSMYNPNIKQKATI